VLTELKRTVDEHQRLSHDEQLVLIHSLGHIEGGPQAVNYLFNRCADVGAEKFLKDRLKGHPMSCPSIRKRIPHITRRVNCNCPFEFAADRYPTPVLYLLTLPETAPAPPAALADVAALAQKFGVLDRRRAELQQEWELLRRLLVESLSRLPDRQVSFDEGDYRVESRDGVDELIWTPKPADPEPQSPPALSG